MSRMRLHALAAALLATSTTAAVAGSATVYYYTPYKAWTTVHMHHNASGSWTTVPGDTMTSACTDWVSKTVDFGSATSFQAVFNNGGGSWDNLNNQAGANYVIGAGIHQVKNGQLLSAAGSPCADSVPPTAPAGLTASNVTSSGLTLSWTAATDSGSGVKGYGVLRNNVLVAQTTGTSAKISGLQASTAYTFKVVAQDNAGNRATSTGLAVTTKAPDLTPPTTPSGLTSSGKTSTSVTLSWNASTDAGGLKGYGVVRNGTLAGSTTATTYTVKGLSPSTAYSFRVIAEDKAGNRSGYSTTLSVTTDAPDVTAPSVPTGLSTQVSGTTVKLNWNAATDASGIKHYTISRTGGTSGTVTFTSASTSYTDSGLQPNTSYSYKISATDNAGNTSAYGSAVSAKTPLVVGGEPLGTDMREDSIYFVMTARFYDGDSSNNRGGAMHEKSGNAANNDPMFRGDFKGLIEKLDYIKGLGFSAIWITPVVLNRSDYDYHGYHGYDFMRVDPRLESPGASYQDLINAAHAKGIKIIQDVVYNHSSRWGAKGLFTPKVYGVRDTQWSWYYDEPVPGFTYDGLTIEPKSGKSWYNGDMWSTSEPAGNTCANWGVPTGSYSKEGYKIYNCQWPNPRSGMFPSQFFHQCWIGNWEGEDSRSCWIHEDLADFNTESAPVQQFLKDVYNKYIDMGVDGFRIDTAVHIPRVMWNRHFLPAAKQRAVEKFGAKGQNFFMFGEVGSFVNDKWNRGSVNHSAQFFTWKERKEYSADDEAAALEQYAHENGLGTSNQPTSTNAFLNGNNYRTPDHSQFSGMSVIDMRMHMNFGDATNAFYNGKDSDDSYNDATMNVVYVDSHDYGPNKSNFRYAGGTDAWAENMSLMWTFRGIPTLYYGSEIEFQAGKQIDCGPTCPLATTGRAYFGDHIEGTVVASDFGVVSSASGAVATTLSKPLVKHVQRLNQIRRKIPALQKGQYSTEGVSGGMAFKRRYTATGVDSFVLVTISGSATFSGIPNGTYTDAVTGDVKNVTNGTLTASVAGKGNARIYVLSTAATPAPGKIGSDGPYLKP